MQKATDGRPYDNTVVFAMKKLADNIRPYGFKRVLFILRDAVPYYKPNLSF